MILGQLYYVFMKGLREINYERTENGLYLIFISLIIFPFSLHMQELQTNFWGKKKKPEQTIGSLKLYDQCCSWIKKLSLNMKLEYNTELHYSGNELNSELKDQETYSCQMKSNPAELKSKLCQLDKEVLVCQISAMEQVMEFI